MNTFQATNDYPLCVGDRVMVTPSRPNAKGRGIGTVVRLGQLLASVKFDHLAGRGPDGSIACFVADLRRVA